MRTRVALAAVVAVALGVCLPPVALGQDATTPTPKPKLTIKEADAVQIIRFRDSRDAKSATVPIGVSPAPEGDVEPPAPRGAAQSDLISEQDDRIANEMVKVSSITWDGISAFRAKIEIAPGDVKPGRYTGTVNFGGSAYAAPIPVSVTATLKSDLGWAAVVAFIGWAAGTLLKACTDLFSAPGEKIRSKTSLKKYFLRSGFIATVAFGAVGAFAAWGFTYLPNDVWGADDLDDLKLFGTAMACVVTGTTFSDFFAPFKGVATGGTAGG